MTETWHAAAARQLRALPTYLALLRSHELPTRIVSALDAASPGDDRERRAIVDLLLRMIQNQHAFAAEATSAAPRRLLAYAHDWACETLLAMLRAPVGEDEEEDEDDGASTAALDEMARALFVWRPHAAEDALAHAEAALEAALRGEGGWRPQVDGVRQLLETCADRVHADAAFLRWLERVVVDADVEVALGPACWQRLLAAGDHGCLMDALSLQARVALWASDVAVWEQQLDAWLVAVHAAPFRAVSGVLGVLDPAPRVAAASHLHVALVAWASREPRGRWLRASRTRALVAAVARLVRDQEADRPHDVYGLRVLAKVPHAVVSADGAAWTPLQRSHVLRCVAQNLAAYPEVSGVDARPKRARHLAFFGLCERREIVQTALDALITQPARDVAAKDFENACAILVWHECVVYDVADESGKAAIEAAVRETASGVGGSASWRDAVAWLQQHRSSSFATCTLTRLRITWRWLVRACLADPEGSLSDALESVEYALRRFAPADDTRRFQVEVIVVFLEDLEWCWGTATAESAHQMQAIGAWLQKLVRLLPSADAAGAASGATSLSQQVEERLDALASHSDAGKR